MQKTPEMGVPSLGWEDPLEEGMATPSSILAWRIPWTEEPSRLQSIQFSSVQSLSHVLLFGIPWTVAYQAPQSVEFSRQEYWSGLPFPSPGDPPNPGMEPSSPVLAGGFFTTEPQGNPTIIMPFL